jgi:hypothetical protein
MEPLLSQRLYEAVSPEFFRPLTRSSARIYVDCADRLVTAAMEAGRLPHGEAVTIIREVLTAHPDVRLEEDEGAALRDVRQRVGQFFNRLSAARWIEDQTLGLHERWAVISPGLRPLLKMARDLAEHDVAELKTFADTVRGVCETLEREGALDPKVCSPEVMRFRVTDLNARLETAIIQLHGVEKLIALFDQKQRMSESPAETLRLFYAEFSTGQHMVCYDVLRRGGLLLRLQALRSMVADRRDDPLAKERLSEGYMEHYGLDSPDAYARAEKALRELEHRLAAIRLVADAIDARMAAFNQLSQQRYRYQTELRGRRPEIVKLYCEVVNNAHANGRFSAMQEASPDFKPLIPEVRFFFGLESLARARRVKTPADLTFNQGRGTEQDSEDVIAGLRERQRLALTPQRAARLMADLLPEKGLETDTSAIAVTTLDEMLDLLAIAAYDNSPMMGRTVRWKVDGARRTNGLNPEKVLLDPQAGWRMERFSISRKA